MKLPWLSTVIAEAAADERRAMQRQQMIAAAALSFDEWVALLNRRQAQREAQRRYNRAHCSCGKSRCRGWCKR